MKRIHPILYVGIVIVATVVVIAIASPYLPAAAWAVIGSVIAATVGLITAYIQNRQNLKKLSLEFRNQKQTRKEERDATLRKDAIYGAVETVAGCRLVLTGILEKDFEQRLKQFARDIPHKLAAVHLTASLSLIKSLTACTAYFDKSLLELLPDRMLIDEMQSDHDQCFKTNELYDMQQKRILAKMEEYNDKQRVDMPYFDSLQAQFDDQQKEIGDSLAKADDLRVQIGILKMALLKKSAAQGLEYQKLVTDLILIARQELDLPFAPPDMLAYQELSNRAIAGSSKAIDDFIDVDMRTALERINNKN